MQGLKIEVSLLHDEYKNDDDKDDEYDEVCKNDVHKDDEYAEVFKNHDDKDDEYDKV